MIYFCCDEQRRIEIRKQERDLNGIDRLEVISQGLPKDRKQRTLRVYFVIPPANNATYELLNLLRDNKFSVYITGGESIKNIRVKSAVYDSDKQYLECDVDPRGDFSTYTMWLCSEDSLGPAKGSFDQLPGLDRQLASVDFAFKVECPTDMDCRAIWACPPKVYDQPQLDYLAKDYSSFRRLILDRMALLLPQWKERHPADLGVTLVELLAHVGDQLSYMQDAVGTEAYLGTARDRVSIRRHARLLDYRMHEGCNARVWVQVRICPDQQEAFILPKNVSLSELDVEKRTAGTCFTTDTGDDTSLGIDVDELVRIIGDRSPEVFEPIHDVFLHQDNNELNFYTWDAGRCCLPKGAVKAAFEGHHAYLAPGQTLIFKEICGPSSGNPSDADLTKRHAVRLIRVNGIDFKTYDNKRRSGTPVNAIIPRKTDELMKCDYVEVEWDADDALPFPFCLSSIDEHGKQIKDVSVALGNIVLADHGWTMIDAESGKEWTVPAPNPVLAPVTDASCGHCSEESQLQRPARFHPKLRLSGLTHVQQLPENFTSLPASSVYNQDPREALPAIQLVDDHGYPWKPQRDLIGSGATARDFVAEIGNDGQALLRFGDDVNGLEPTEDGTFFARYRVGNGSRGNVGADTITQIFAPEFLNPEVFPEERRAIASDTSVIESVTNPMPARGGIDPERLEDVRQYAPQAFKTPRRCVTAEDYARRAEEHPAVQRAAARIRWTGSWHTIFLTVDRTDGLPVTTGFQEELLAWLEPWRMAGHDLRVNQPVYVSIELSLTVCISDGYFRSDVESVLLDAFSTRRRPDGSLGFFHPDKFTFGDPVFASAIYAVAQGVAGVNHVEITALRRQGSDDKEVPDVFTVEPLQIVRLENDPSFPDHGLLNLTLMGGR